MGLRVDLLKLTDALIGRTACALLGSSAVDSEHPGRPPERVLVIRPGGIGDAVLMIPMLRALRTAWPRTRIDLLLESRNTGVLKDTQLADEIFSYDRPFTDLRALLRNDYDLVIDTEQYHRLSAVFARLTGAPRRVGFGSNDRRRLLTDCVPYSQDLYEAYSFLELAHAAIALTDVPEPPGWSPDAPFYPLSEQALKFADDKLEDLAGVRRVAIHPGASIPERRWPPERYAKLARLICERGDGVVILGGPTDGRAASVIETELRAANARFVNLAGRSNLMQAAALVSKVDVYVSADTGLLHLAFGVGTPSVHLFGPGVLSKWGPPGSRFRTVRNDVPCSPCTRYGYTPPCNQGLRCMIGITPEQVFDAVVEQLDQRLLPVAAARVDERAS